VRASAKMNIFVPDMEKQRSKTLRLKGNTFIHVLIWCIVFTLPIMFAQRERIFRWTDIVMFLPLSISFVIVFYANYFYLVNKFLFKKKVAQFIAVNVVMIVSIALLLHTWHEVEHAFHIVERASGPPVHLHKTPVIMFILRDILSLVFIAVLGIVLKATEQVTRMQTRHKEMEKAMTETELKNLRNQINPHFLLNTLNNIYALSRFNSPKTSPAIMKLGELLRYVLYENEQPFVSLHDEVAFINNYIDLMKLRLTDNVKVSTRVTIPPDSTTTIAPLIFISLIENAFKHGVSNDEPSFIDMELIEKEKGHVYFLCRNSNFPKKESDRSGSGIGLQQVQKRLDLLYPYRYALHNEIDENTYSTVLIINTSENNEPDS